MGLAEYKDYEEFGVKVSLENAVSWNGFRA